MLTAEDRWSISETLSLRGHIFDGGQLDGLEEIFAPDVVYDLTDAGSELSKGSRQSGAEPCNSAQVTPSLIT